MLILITWLKMSIVYALSLAIYFVWSPEIAEWRRRRAMRKQLRRNGLRLPRVVVLRRRSGRIV